MNHRACPTNRTLRAFFLHALIVPGVLLLAVSAPSAQYVRLVGDGEPLAWLPGTGEPPGTWTNTDFDDSSWQRGIPPLGFGGHAVATLAEGMPGAYTSLYVRRVFELPDTVGSPPTVNRLWLTVDATDSFVAYLNGVEIARRGRGAAGSPAAHDAPGRPWRQSAASDIDVSTHLDLLAPGRNVLALEGHLSSPRAASFRLAATLREEGPIAVVRYPYIQRPSPDTVVIAWKTGPASYGGMVTVPREAGRTPGSMRSFTDGALTEFHTMTLTGLAPDTEYSYVVTANGRALTGGDTFRTLPAPGSSRIEFVAVGDSGIDDPVSRAVRSRWLATGAPMGLRLGDIAYDSGHPVEYDRNYYGVYRDFVRQAFDFPTVGNHDAYTARGAAYLASFFTPRDFPGGKGRYFAFEAGPALFVSLDVFTSAYGPGSAQRGWLEQVLASSRMPWKFVIMHWGPYCCAKGHESNLKARESLSPLFERYGVDVVFAGHNHGYERSRPVLDYDLSGSAVRYITSGGGGRTLQPWDQGCPWTAFSKVMYELVHVVVEADRINLTALEPDGTVLDSESWSKTGARTSQ